MYSDPVIVRHKQVPAQAASNSVGFGTRDRQQTMLSSFTILIATYTQYKTEPGTHQ
jgi:hypothetical protein